MKNIYFSMLLLAFPAVFLTAQEDDLLSLLEEEEIIEYVDAAFKTNRVIHGHSIESTAGGVLDFKISHRFGMLNTGFYQLWGLDNTNIRFGFDYGITDQVTVGIGRNSFQTIFDGFIKYKFLRQSTGKRNMPISAALISTVELMGTEKAPDPENPSTSRFAYIHQLLIGSKLSNKFSLQLMPTLVHRNVVNHNEENNVLAIGLGARQKITNWVAINFEYYLVPGNQLPDNYHSSLSIGFDIETGGHVFQLHFTNSTSMTQRGFIAETTGDWTDGGIHFGFNISRVFTLKKPKGE